MVYNTNTKFDRKLQFEPFFKDLLDHLDCLVTLEHQDAMEIQDPQVHLEIKDSQDLLDPKEHPEHQGSHSRDLLDYLEILELQEGKDLQELMDYQEEQVRSFALENDFFPQNVTKKIIGKNIYSQPLVTSDYIYLVPRNGKFDCIVPNSRTELLSRIFSMQFIRMINQKM